MPVNLWKVLWGKKTMLWTADWIGSALLIVKFLMLQSYVKGNCASLCGDTNGSVHAPVGLKGLNNSVAVSPTDELSVLIHLKIGLQQFMSQRPRSYLWEPGRDCSGRCRWPSGWSVGAAGPQCGSAWPGTAPAAAALAVRLYNRRRKQRERWAGDTTESKLSD